MIALDTHVLVWWVVNDARLARKARSAISRELPDGRLGIPAICAWEIGMLVARGRLLLSMDVDRWFEAVQAVQGVVLLPLGIDVALDSTRLPGQFHGDPADRMIVATARAHNAPLISADPRIRDYRHVRTIW